MDPNTLGLIVLAEQLAALLAKTVSDIKSVVAGTHTQTTSQILDDADNKWDEIIANAKDAEPLPPSAASE